eukprot:Tamp_26882.p3 GENE.Tamp_26882~~Tamp_26882.p3  ORF type:complete len:123 (+),score=21.71 Tamp_26882:249-617(+)
MCAEYFLSSLKDVDGDGTRGEVLGRNGPPTVKLLGFPKLSEYSKCMNTLTNYQMKACIREVTRAVSDPNIMARDLVHISHTGQVSKAEQERLTKVAAYTIHSAQPDASLEDVNSWVWTAVRR